MSDDAVEIQQPHGPGAGERTDLAYHRSRWAAERTLMAWIRTAISMVTFGIALDRFFAYFGDAQVEPMDDSWQRFGVLLVTCGVLLLMLAVGEHVIILRRLKRRQPLPGGSFSLPLLGASLVLLIGMAAIVLSLVNPQ